MSLSFEIKLALIIQPGSKVQANPILSRPLPIGGGNDDDDDDDGRVSWKTPRTSRARETKKNNPTARH